MSRFQRLRTFANWSIAQKVAALLALPVLLATLLGGLRVSDSLNEAADLATAETQAELLPEVFAFVDATDEDLARRTGETRTAMEEATAVLRNEINGAELTDDQIKDLNAAISSAEQLPLASEYPVAVREGLYEISASIEAYVNSINVDSQDAEAAMAAYVAGLRSRLALTEQRVALSGARPVTEAQRQAAIGAAGREASGLTSAALADDTTAAGLQKENVTRQVSLDGTSSAATRAAQASAAKASATYAEYGATLSHRAADTLLVETRDARSDALRDVAIVLGVLLAVFALALLVARMLIQPISRVRRDALRVAHEELPKAVAQIQEGEQPAPLKVVGVRTEEEIGQLARAVDEIHGQARRLAGEQAMLRAQVNNMFETLSRRSATLVTQQLSLLDQLEREEEDPSRLSRLFQLDHLAARMRRNGQSLLVLADVDGRRGNSADIALADVFRAAMSEVSGYERVRLEVPFESVVAGSAAPDLVHLFAELLDNAVTYGPPTSEVIIRGVQLPSGEVRVEIIDRGLGMPQEALDEINRSLASGGEVTASTARRMGLFVVGRLARRYGLVVHLVDNQAIGTPGTTAVVDLPGHLAVDPAVSRPSVTAPTLESMEDADTSTNLAPVPSPVAAPVAPPISAPIIDRPMPVSFAAAPEAPKNASVPEPANRWHDAAQPTPTAAAAAAAIAAAAGRTSTNQPRLVEQARPSGLDRPMSQSSSLPDWSANNYEAPVTPERAETPPAAKVDDSPIFAELRSAWLTGQGFERWSSPTIDHGWKAAEKAEVEPAVSLTDAGLPMRTPGARLVPGTIDDAAKPASPRDPERIRRSLTHHLDGVRRGRAAGRSEDSDRD